MYDTRITLAWDREGTAPLEAIVAALPAGGTAGHPRPDQLVITTCTHHTEAHRAAAFARELAEEALIAAGVERLPVIALDTCWPEETERRAEVRAVPALVSTAEAAEILGVTTAAVRARAPHGAWGAIRVGEAWVFPRAEVEAAAPARMGR